MILQLQMFMKHFFIMLLLEKQLVFIFARAFVKNFLRVWYCMNLLSMSKKMRLRAVVCIVGLSLFDPQIIEKSQVIFLMS